MVQLFKPPAGFKRVWVCDTPFLLSDETIGAMKTLHTCIASTKDELTVIDGHPEEFREVINYVTRQFEKPPLTPKLKKMLDYWDVSYEEASESEEEESPAPTTTPKKRRLEVFLDGNDYGPSRWNFYGIHEDEKDERIFFTVSFFDGVVKVPRNQFPEMFHTQLRNVIITHQPFDGDPVLVSYNYGAKTLLEALENKEKIDWSKVFNKKPWCY
jgi:hypothetical protein